MIVDDHPMIRKGLDSMLGQHPDIQVMGQAGDGLDAVAKARELLPNIILMDLRMPRMDGVAPINEIVNSKLNTGVILFRGFMCDEGI